MLDVDAQIIHCSALIISDEPSPQRLHARHEFRKIALPTKTEVGQRRVDRSSTVKVAVLVMLFQDFVDRLLVEHAVVL